MAGARVLEDARRAAGAERTADAERAADAERTPDAERTADARVLTREAVESTFHGERAVVLQWGNLQATVLPKVGANLVSFRDVTRGFAFLHEPGADEMDDFRQKPYLYGTPVLFPPNRYDGGTFTYAGKRVQLPVNEEATGTHLHGFLYDFPWEVTDFGSNCAESYVVLSAEVYETHPLYAQWPFCFTVELRYELSESGLAQHISVRNDGDDMMPCLIGFHTAFNAPFADHGDAQRRSAERVGAERGDVERVGAEDYRCRVSIGDRWELDDRGLPTGVKLPLTAYELALRDEGAYPFALPMDNHYTALAQNGYNRMELWDIRSGVTLVYDVGPSFRQWMFWNHNGEPGFFCAEPQVNVVNAPNLVSVRNFGDAASMIDASSVVDAANFGVASNGVNATRAVNDRKAGLTADEIGLIPVRPGEVWEAHSRLYVRDGGFE